MNKPLLSLLLSFMGTALFIIVLAVFLPFRFFFMPVVIGLIFLGICDLIAIGEMLSWLEKTADKEDYEKIIKRLDHRIAELEKEKQI